MLSKALAALRRKAAISSHSTATSDGSWDGPANEARLESNEADLRKAYAWVSDGDKDAKSSYAFIHHEVSSDGSVGAANMNACRTGIGILNGGRGVNPSEQPWGNDRRAIFNHLARHLKDAGLEPPDLQTRALTRPESPFFVVKQGDGTYRWVGFSATAFIDRQGEIISTKALERAVEYIDETGDYGPLLLWHTEEAEIGTADFSALEGRILIESGVVNDPSVAERLMSYEEPLGMSIGAFVAADENPRVFDWAFIFERSVVPLDAAANPYTAFGMEAPMDDRKFEFLRRIVGEDAATQLMNTAKATSAALEGSGVAYKSLDDPEDVIRSAVSNASEETQAAVEEALKALTASGQGDTDPAPDPAPDTSTAVKSDDSGAIIDATATKDAATAQADPPAADPAADQDSSTPSSEDAQQAGQSTPAAQAAQTAVEDEEARQAIAALEERIAQIEASSTAVQSDVSDIKGSIGELVETVKDMSGAPKIKNSFANRPTNSDDNKVDPEQTFKDALPQNASPVDGYLEDILGKVSS